MLPIKDECNLCKRILPTSILTHCQTCRKLYCTNCTTHTQNGNTICLNCARKNITPKKLGTKYSPLSRHLLKKAQYTNQTVLPFAEIEAIISDNLPFTAIQNPEWWTNTRATAQGRAWTDVGWTIQHVDLNKRTVTLKRTTQTKPETQNKPKEKTSTTWAKKTLRFTTPKKRLPPSKTKLAKAQARLRNVERERAKTQQFKGKLKPKPASEKRLYKPQAKPSNTIA